MRRSRSTQALSDVGQVGCSALDGARSRAQPEHAFHHESLFYLGEDGFLAGALPFIEGGLTTGEPLLVVVGADRSNQLKEALGDDARRVRFTDLHTLGRNPARLIPAWRDFLEREASDGRPVRGISELRWSARSPAELTECQHHESLLNLAFGGGQAWRLLCPYDLATIDAQVIEAAKRSHPFISEGGARQRSDAYVHAHEAPGSLDGALPEPGTRPLELAFTRGELGLLRGSVASWASDTLLGAERTEHLVLSVNELATNSVRHGGGRGVLRMWRDDDTLICEVNDRGWIDEPLAGRIAPTPDQLAGRGLWLVNQLCDLVQIRSTPEGSVVRLHLHLTQV